MIYDPKVARMECAKCRVEILSVRRDGCDEKPCPQAGIMLTDHGKPRP